MNKQRIKYYICCLLGLLLGIFIDQYTKTLAVEKLKDQEPFIIIKNVFQLHYLENKGAAFGMLQGKQSFFIISFIFIIAIIAYLYIKLPTAKRFIGLHVCSVLIVSGAIGNMIDRIQLGYVIDFFYFELIDFPIFNVADIFVVVGVVLLAILILFVYSEEEVDDVLSFRLMNRK